MSTNYRWFDALAGSIDAGHGLSAGGTALTSASLAASGLPTIAAPDVVRLTFYVRDPVTGRITAWEGVLLTAYTSGAASGTIQRGVAGTNQAWNDVNGNPPGLWTHGQWAEDTIMLEQQAILTSHLLYN